MACRQRAGEGPCRIAVKTIPDRAEILEAGRTDHFVLQIPVGDMTFDEAKRTMDAFCSDEISDGDFIRWAHFAASAAAHLWDWPRWEFVSAKHVELARASGALARLSIALSGRGVFAAWCGDDEATTALVAEWTAVNDATGIGWFDSAGLLQAAYRGRPEALALMDASAAGCSDRGLGLGAQYARWTN